MNIKQNAMHSANNRIHSVASRHRRLSWLALAARMQTRVARDDRGDVPGWVLVTVMTAGLVTAIWLVADTQLKAVLERAMASLGTK